MKQQQHYTTLKKDLLGVMSVKDKVGASWIGYGKPSVDNADHTISESMQWTAPQQTLQLQ